MARVIVNDVADRDTDEIFVKITEAAGVDSAVEYDDAFDAFYQRLADFPMICPLRVELGKDVRIGVVRPYVIIYRYDHSDDSAEVLRIVHGHRNLTAVLLPQRD